LNLMSDIKSQLQESDADPKQLKNQIHHRLYFHNL